MRVRRLKLDPIWEEPRYPWEWMWEGPPMLPIYRPICWAKGHIPQNVTTVNPRTGRETPRLVCGLCGKWFGEKPPEPPVQYTMAYYQESKP